LFELIDLASQDYFLLFTDLPYLPVLPLAFLLQPSDFPLIRLPLECKFLMDSGDFLGMLQQDGSIFTL
jgi:hypothetical protein